VTEIQGGELEALLAEQVAYYRAAAPEYEDHALPYVRESSKELVAALDAFAPQGDVLEFACGPGTWTRHLVRHAATVTCVDASPEMLAVARRRLEGKPVRFERADLFAWRPSERYDVVFFGFWLSHVPPERFEPFWSLVAECLKPGGRVFFIDDGYRTEDELVYGESSIAIRRLLADGSAHRIVKVPLEPGGLERRLRDLGWAIRVKRTDSPGPFLWGAGSR
jgi:SAM-dependent methyltransferase